MTEDIVHQLVNGLQDSPDGKERTIPFETAASPAGQPVEGESEEMTPGALALSHSLSLGDASQSEAEGVKGPPFTLDDVRALVQEGLAHTRDEMTRTLQEELDQSREDVPRLVQAELARERQDRRRASLSALQQAADGISELKLEFLATELGVLDEEERRALQDADAPLRDRMALVDFIRERRTRVEGQIAGLEAALARRVAEMDLALAERDGRNIVASLREGLGRQRQDVAAAETKLAVRSSAGAAVLGLWPALLALLLAVTVGVAGILLPRRTGTAPTLLVEMATLYQASGETEEAIRVLDEALEAGVRDAETLGRVGQTYYALKEYAKALGVLEQAMKKDPRNEETRLALARSYGRTGQHQEAIAQCERLIEINPGNWRYRAEAGQNYASLKDYDRALAQFQKILEFDPNLWQAHFYQGNVYRSLERYDEAIAQYRRVVELNPNHYWAWMYYGLSYAGKSDLSHAIEQYEAAIAVDPERADAYYYLGEAYLAQGHFADALEPYQRAVALQPNRADARLGLGKVYLSLDDCEKAQTEFLEVLRLQPSDEEAQQGMEVCGRE